MTATDGSRTVGRGYRLYTFRGRPVMSLAHTRLGRQVALQRFQPTSSRRRTFRAGVALASLTGADRWLAHHQDSVFPAELEPPAATWIAATLRDLGAAEDGIVVMWPPQPGRGRFYVHGADAGGRPVAFVKVALDERNARQLTREVGTLRELAGEHLSTMSVPAVLAAERVGGALVVVGQALPSDARSPAGRRTVLPPAVVAEYAGAVRSATDVTSTSWWRAYRDRVVPATSAFHEELTDRIRGGVRTARAHGDLSVHNMALSAGRLWLLDWEESAPDAPVLTDRLGFAMSTVARSLVRKPEGWRGYLRHAADGLDRLDRLDRVDLMAALAFRYARGFGDVVGVVRQWDRSAGWGVG